MAQSTIVILNTDNGFMDEVEPGVRLQRSFPSGLGPLNGVMLEFSCGSCDVATFQDAVTRIGGGASLCGYQSEVPRTIVEQDFLLCIRSTITGYRYDLDLVTWSSIDKTPGMAGMPECIDADDGASCGNVNGLTSYIRSTPATPADLLEQLSQELIWLNLHEGTEKSLMAKLNGAAKKLTKNDVAAAVNKLEAFINEVEAQSGKKIYEDDADELIAAADEIINLL